MAAVAEIMAGHAEFADIPQDKKFPLWQATSGGHGGVQRGWRPVLHDCIYYAPDGKLKDKVGIFCTATGDRNSFKKGKKWATHAEMILHFEAQQAWIDAAPAREAAEQRRAAKVAAKKDVTRRDFGLTPLRIRKKPRMPKINDGISGRGF